MRTFRDGFLIICLASFGVCRANAGESVTFDKAVQIPEATLQPGQYRIAIEDRLRDRAIVRIKSPDGVDHYILSMPRKDLGGNHAGLVYFAGSSTIRAWHCSECKWPLEFVYPKDDAVRLMSETGQSVLAFDPAYDKLPADLSAADRKVVTLWMLSPKELTPGSGAPAVAAQKLTTPVTVANRIPLSMPKTASNAAVEIILGFGLWILGFAPILRRKMIHRATHV